MRTTYRLTFSFVIRLLASCTSGIVSRVGIPTFRDLLDCTASGVIEIAIDMVNTERWDLNGRDSNGATLLIWAARYGKCVLAKLFLEPGGVDPILSDKLGLAPLAHAAKSGHEDVVELLLEWRGLSSDFADGCGRTPLSYAAEAGQCSQPSSPSVFGGGRDGL